MLSVMPVVTPIATHEDIASMTPRRSTSAPQEAWAVDLMGDGPQGVAFPIPAKSAEPQPPDDAEVLSSAPSDSSSSDGGGRFASLPTRHKVIFANVDEMKMKVRAAVTKKPYNVQAFYKQDGVFQLIARHPLFENATLFIIIVNAFWMWYDADENHSDSLLEAEWQFQVMEHIFCVFFSLELYIRFASFKSKRNCLKDGWFVFDSCLVLLMVMETWLMTSVMVIAGGAPSFFDVSILRLFRLLRLSRLARMLRSMPELMILIKGLLSAARSVLFTLLLLVLLLYMFAIALRQLTANNPVIAKDSGANLFGDVPRSMYNLLISGVFLENLAPVMDDIRGTHPLYSVIFMVFVILAALMVMNMLIGVLCEVVSAVAAAEREDMMVTSVKEKMEEVTKHVDQEVRDAGDPERPRCDITEEEFKDIMNNDTVVKKLHEAGVDAEGLVDFADWIFEPEDPSKKGQSDGDERRAITFENFMTVLLDFRGANPASVKHIMNLVKLIKSEFLSLSVRLDRELPTRSRQDSKPSIKCRERPSMKAAPCMEVTSSRPTVNVPSLSLAECASPRSLDSNTVTAVSSGPKGAAFMSTAKVEAFFAAAKAELNGVQFGASHSGGLVGQAGLGCVRESDAEARGEQRLREWATRVGRALDRELQELHDLQRLEQTLNS